MNTESSNYVEISAEAILPDIELDYELYIQLHDSKFVKVALEGATLTNQQYRSYLSKGLKNFYVKSTDLVKLLNLDIHQLSLPDVSYPGREREELLFYMGKPIYQYFEKLNIKTEIFDVSKKFLDISLSLISTRDDYMHLVKNLRDREDYDYMHAFSVALCSSLFAQEFQFFTSEDIFHVTLASFFHDIGKTQLDPKVFEIPFIELSMAERYQYHKHVEHSIRLLKEVKDIPATVIRVVSEHHEFSDGTGYPRGLKKSQIHKLSQVLILTNLFCKYVFPRQVDKAMTSKAALEYLENTYISKLDDVIFQKFASYFY